MITLDPVHAKRKEKRKKEKVFPLLCSKNFFEQIKNISIKIIDDFLKAIKLLYDCWVL